MAKPVKVTDRDRGWNRKKTFDKPYAIALQEKV